MKNRKSWKKALSFTFALAVTAGVISNNSAALLNEKRITAAAAETAEKPEEQITANDGQTDTQEESELSSTEEDVSSESNDDTEESDDTSEPVITTGEDCETDDKAERTIMLYLCGADLESDHKCGTYTLHQILSSDFGKSGDVNFIVMTGGSINWHTESEYLYDPATGTSPETISGEYNQIWEAKGISDKENPGQLVLIDGDGLSGDGEDAKTSAEEPMNDPETLKAFINYTVENYPAEKYDLILWDHGGGPNSGFGSDEHLGDDSEEMSFAGLADAFSDNAVTKNGGKFDFIDFDACLMGSLDLALAFADYTDYYIASPELEPGYSQRFDNWLNEVGEDPGIDTYELGKIIVDDMIDFYESEDSDGYGQDATLSIINTKKLLESDLVSAMTDFTNIMKKDLDEPNEDGEYYFYDEFFAWASSINYSEGKVNYFDLGTVMENLSSNFYNFVDGNDISTYTETAERVLTVLEDPEVIYSRGTANVCTNEPIVYFNEDGNYDLAIFGTSGIYLPAVKQDLKSKTMNYFIALDDALEVMNDSDAKSFLKNYVSVLNDYALIAETGYAVSALSDRGVAKSDITYDMIRDYWHEGYIEDGETESATWKRVSFFLDRHDGGEAAASSWLEPYIRQIASEVISPEKVSVQFVEGADENKYIVNTEDTHKRLIDSVKLTYTAELPAVEEYWENSPLKKYRYILCPDLILGQREADVQIDLEEGENQIDAIIRWFDNMSSTWEIESISDKWYAVSDAEGVLHVAVTQEAGEYTWVPAVTYDEEGYETLVVLCFFEGDLTYIKIYNDIDTMVPVVIPASNLTNEIELMSVYFNKEYIYSVPLSRSSFVLSADNADKFKLVYTDVADIPDIADIDGDGKAITESLVITDMYDYTFDISEKFAAPEKTLINIADAVIENVEYDGTTKRPVVVYNGNILTEGKDYTILTSDMSIGFVEAGSYSITVYGKGEFGGSKEILYEIIDKTDFATREDFGKMAKIDFEKKNDVEVTPVSIRNTDGTVSVYMLDAEENVVDNYTLDAKTGVGTDSQGNEVDLPQTGMSGAHKAVTGVAAIMLLAGAVLVKKSRREDEE